MPGTDLLGYVTLEEVTGSESQLAMNAKTMKLGYNIVELELLSWLLVSRPLVICFGLLTWSSAERMTWIFPSAHSFLRGIGCSPIDVLGYRLLGQVQGLFEHVAVRF